MPAPRRLADGHVCCSNPHVLCAACAAHFGRAPYPQPKTQHGIAHEERHMQKADALDDTDDALTFDPALPYKERYKRTLGRSFANLRTATRAAAPRIWAFREAARRVVARRQRANAAPPDGYTRALETRRGDCLSQSAALDIAFAESAGSAAVDGYAVALALRRANKEVR
jgi:hypothetical protein